jgi:DNA invertase Pin-like site-specific DNA recombinase
VSSLRPLIPYLRQSRKQELSISIEEQDRDVRAWAKAQGEVISEPLVERGVSGSKGWRERELGQAVEACERGQAAGIIVAWQDRLSRENGLATAEVWEALQAAGCRLVCVGDGIDTASGDHELIFTIKAAIARDQWKRHRSNWLRARRNAVERGVYVGLAPAGYRVTEAGTLEPSEHAPAIVRAFELRAAGASWGQVAAHLTDAGVPTAWDGRQRAGETIDGRAWSLSAVPKLLANRAFLGEVRSGEFVNERAHEPLVSRALFAAVQARRQERASTLLQREPRLLTGLIRCGSCGHRLTTDWRSRSGGGRYYTYRCHNTAKGKCPRPVACGAEKIETALEEVLREELAAEAFRITVAGTSEVTDLERELELAKQALAEWVATDQTVSAEVWQARTTVLDTRVGEAREALAVAEATGLSASRLPSLETYDLLPITERRTVMSAWLDAKGFQLRLLPGNHPNRYQLIPLTDQAKIALSELYGNAKADALAALA